MSEDQDMNDLTGWQRIPCAVADVLRHSGAMSVFSSLTDPDGLHGSAVVYTEWGIAKGSPGTQVTADLPLLREYRWPKDDNRPCGHYVPEVSP